MAFCSATRDAVDSAMSWETPLTNYADDADDGRATGRRHDEGRVGLNRLQGAGGLRQAAAGAAARDGQQHDSNRPARQAACERFGRSAGHAADGVARLSWQSLNHM